MCMFIVVYIISTYIGWKLVRLPWLLFQKGNEKSFWTLTTSTFSLHRLRLTYRVEAISNMLKNNDFCEYVKYGAISWKFDILLITA